MMHKTQIVFDAERMKYPHTGLYHYCLQLGAALQQIINTEEETLSFYVRPGHEKAFGEHADYIEQHSLHKFYMPVKKGQVWHTTYQATNYFPFTKKAKVVFTIHDLNVVHENKMSPQRLKKELNKIQKRINAADHIVAISHFTLADIKKHLKLHNKPTTVIHNGCNIKLMDNIQAPKIFPTASFLFTLGTINAKKNFHVLPCLLAGNDKQLFIAGITDDENYKQQIINEAVKFGVEQRVVFAGPINENDKQWYMQHCEAFVFPSLAEGFGLPVIEAMYFGKPVIISNSTALPEIGGDAAYYFTDFVPENMQMILAQSLASYHADLSAKTNIMARAKMFTWQDAAEKYLNVYRSLY
ncbi:MAG: glycosyltransferase family 4 protein [Ferruginibacter sp.]